MLEFIRMMPGMSSVLTQIYHPQKESRIELFGCSFRHRLGLAAGFDKNARHLDALANLGFAFIEVGSVTAQAWDGNPKPRLFRLKNDMAIINRMGLNNDGCSAIAQRLAQRTVGIPIFVNVAKTADSTIEGQDAIEDYCESIRSVKANADVLVINISCPNSGDGRTFEDPDALDTLLAAVHEAVGPDGPPFLVKLSPDLSEEGIDHVVRLATRHGASGFTATNTTTDRRGLKMSAQSLEGIGLGGLSGHPLNQKAVHVVRTLRHKTDKPIIGVGGITNAESAQAFIDAGASLVQVYSGFVYRGPSLIREVSDHLSIS